MPNPAPPGRSEAANPPLWRTLLRTLNRRKWLLLGAGLLPPLAAVAVLSLVSPEYTATTRLLFESEAPANVTATNVIATIESAAFLDRVVEKLNLRQDPEFLFMPVSFFDAPWVWVKTHSLELCGIVCTTGFDYFDYKVDKPRQYRSVTDALQQRIVSSVRTDSRVLAISARSVDRNKAKLLSDTVASQFVEEATLAAHDEERRAAAQFADQLSILWHNADLALQAVTDFRQQSGLLGETEDKAASRTLTNLNTQLGQAQSQVLDRQSRILALQRAQSSQDTRGAATDLLTNPVIGALRVQESDASRRLVDVSQRYGENHPRVTEARAELGQIRGSIATEVKKITGTLDGELAAFQAREKQLQEQVLTLEQRVRSFEQKEIELRQLERIAEKEETSYRDLLRHANEARGRPIRGDGATRVLALAPVPEFPSYPRFVETVLISLVAGLLSGLFATWLLELFDSGFRTAEQIERLTGRTLIGMVPALPRSILRKLTPVKYVSARPTSAYAEALRSVHTSISLSSRELEPKVIMITSSVPGEGKSTFSCSLAELVARSNPGKKVIIVDCDLRRSTVLGLLAAPATPGTIDEYLSGAKELHMVIGREERSGLYYIPAKFDTVNSAELLASQKMRSLIDALAKEFDVVFLDTPPLMAVADPRVVAQLADYIVYLVQWEKTKRDVSITALKIIADAPNVGLVLSQVDLRRHARYGYADLGTYYSKYSTYYLNS